LLADPGRVQSGVTNSGVVGNSAAACDLAYKAMESRNFEQAIEHVQPWASQGDPLALRYMVTLMGLTEGVDSARQWAEVSQRFGVTDAMLHFGLTLHDDGHVVEALYWYNSAAEAGNVGAAALLGFRAAEMGDLASAQRWFSECLRNATDDDADVVAEVRQGLVSYGLADH
jgi:TPR repeat protein